MLTCHLMGGLGNQLFQIFATISNAIRTKQRFAFLYSESLGANGDTIRSTYWNTFFVRLKPFLTNFLPQPMHIIREESFYYKQPNVPTEGDNCIFGYFQSYKYFEDNYDTICKMIGIQGLKNNYLVQENTISMHFRIGDYKKVQHFHPILTYEYYRNSIDHILSESTDSYDGVGPVYTILYFCENQDIDDVDIIINRLKTDYPTIVFTKASNDIPDWGQMLTMSNCQHNIIANSSFSWWAAYFNNNPNKIVCYPSIWFGVSSENNTIDLLASMSGLSDRRVSYIDAFGSDIINLEKEWRQQIKSIENEEDSSKRLQMINGLNFMKSKIRAAITIDLCHPKWKCIFFL